MKQRQPYLICGLCKEPIVDEDPKVFDPKIGIPGFYHRECYEVVKENLKLLLDNEEEDAQ